MLAAYLNGAGRIESRDDPVPDISDGQVLVRIESVGVCGSDVHYYRHGRIGPFVASEPLILGHESAGRVVRVGPSVTSLREGARAGAIQTIVSDVSPHRLALARRLGATHTVDARSESVSDVVGELTRGEGVDVVVEAVGATETHQEALAVAARGGTVVLVGWSVERQIPLDVHAIGAKELAVKGMFHYCNVYPEAIRLVAGGAVDVKSLVTHSYRLAQVESALCFASERKEGTVKVMVHTS